MARILAFALALVSLLVLEPARADDQARLGLQIKSVTSGDERPALLLSPPEGFKSLVVKLTRNDGHEQTLRVGAVAAGATHELPVDQPKGRFDYQGAFKVSWANGDKSDLTMSFTLTRIDKLALELDPAQVNLEARTLRFKLSNPAQRAEITVFGQDQKPLTTAKADYAGAAAGTELVLSWPDPGASMLYLELKVWDIAGFWTGVRLTPFSIEIPHEDVEFDSGKFDIRRSEEHKLDASYTLIQEAIEKHGKLLPMRLYVEGHTDTVGSKPANQTLSENRARAISSWFRRKGVKIPIFYAGYGESAPAKPTPDETAEQKNRRAVYIVATQTPPTREGHPNASWKPL